MFNPEGNYVFNTYNFKFYSYKQQVMLSTTSSLIFTFQFQPSIRAVVFLFAPATCVSLVLKNRMCLCGSNRS